MTLIAAPFLAVLAAVGFACLWSPSVPTRVAGAGALCFLVWATQGA